MTRTIGITAMGAALPRARLAMEAVTSAWHNQPPEVTIRAGVRTRTVAEPDEDTITLAAEAAVLALQEWDGPVDAVFLGTQTGPYLSRASAAVLVDILGIGPDVFAVDLQFAGKSGTAALISAAAFVASGLGAVALALGADVLGAHVAPGDPREHVAGAGAAAVLVTADPVVATIDAVASCSSDTADAYRLDGERYLRGTGAVMSATGVGLEGHAARAWETLSRRVDVAAVSRLATSQPDAATPGRLARRLGLAPVVVDGTVLADRTGDTGAASPLLALVAALESAGPGDRVGVVSYGTGAGSDALALTTLRPPPPSGLRAALEDAVCIDYPTAVRYERRYHGHRTLMGAYE